MQCFTGGFNEWFCLNYARIKERLSLCNSLDEDCLHDAYLYIVCGNTDIPYDKSERVFTKVYALERRRRISRGFQYVYPDPIFFEFLHDEEELEDIPPKKDTRPSASRVVQYVKLHTDTSQYEMFNLCVLQNMPYSYIADYMGISPKKVSETIDGIKKSVQRFFRKEVI